MPTMLQDVRTRAHVLGPSNTTHRARKVLCIDDEPLCVYIKTLELKLLRWHDDQAMEPLEVRQRRHTAKLFLWLPKKS